MADPLLYDKAGQLLKGPAPKPSWEDETLSYYNIAPADLYFDPETGKRLTKREYAGKLGAIKGYLDTHQSLAPGIPPGSGLDTRFEELQRFVPAYTKAPPPPEPEGPKQELDLNADLENIFGGGGFAKSLRGARANLESYKPYRDRLASIDKTLQGLSEPELKALNREERLQAAFAENPQVSRNDVRLSDTDRNDVLMKLGLGILASPGGDFSETFGLAGQAAQDMAGGRRDRAFSELQAERAERLRQADALLRAAGEDTSEMNAQTLAQRAAKLERLAAESDAVNAGAGLVRNANQDEIGAKRLELERAVAIQGARATRMNDPIARAQVARYLADVETGNYSDKTKAQAKYLARMFKADAEMSPKDRADLMLKVFEMGLSPTDTVRILSPFMDKEEIARMVPAAK